jgi:hypothetical protein
MGVAISGMARRLWCDLHRPSPMRSLAEIEGQSAQSFIILQPKRVTAAPTAVQINGTIDPGPDSLTSDARWNPYELPRDPHHPRARW